MQSTQLRVSSSYFDAVKTSLKITFDSQITVQTSSNLVVLLTQQSQLIEIKIKSIRTSSQDLLIELDFKETPEFKDKEVNINAENLIIITRNMLTAYKANQPLPSTITIKMKNSP